MLEQFFECEENCLVFEDYEIRQIWAKKQLIDCKFVYAVAEEVSVSHIYHNHTHSSSGLGGAKRFDAWAFCTPGFCDAPQQYCGRR